MKIRISRSAFVAASFILVCILFSIATSLGLSDEAPLIAAIVWFASITLFLVFISRNIVRKSNDTVVFFATYIVKVAYAVWKYGLTNLASPALSNDAGRFWRTAIQYSSGDFTRSYTSFPVFLEVAFRVFGKNVLCVCFTNILLTMVMLLLIIRLLDKFKIEGNLRVFSLLIGGFLIYNIITCVSILRESVYCAFIFASFFIYQKHVDTGETKYLVGALVCLVPVLVLHSGYFPLAVVYFVDSLVNNKIKSKSDAFQRILIIFVFAAFIIATLSLNSMDYILGSSRSFQTIINKIVNANSDETIVNAGSRYLENVRITSVGTFLLYSPIKLVFYLFSPVPTDWRGLTDVLAFVLDAGVQLASILASIFAIRFINKNADLSNKEVKSAKRTLQVGLWAILLCAFVFGLGTSTAGTAIRHRDVMVGINAFLIGYSFSVLKKRSVTWE